LADGSVDCDQLLAEFLKAMKLGDLLLGLAQCRRVGEGLRDRLAGHSVGQAKLGIVSRVVGLGAMAGRLTTALAHGGNGAGAKVPQAEEFLQDLGAFGFQGSERFRHKGKFLSVRIYTLRIMPQKKKIRQMPLLRRAPYTRLNIDQFRSA
jgi:hypothetical protein